MRPRKPCPDPRKGEAKRHQEPQAPTRAENGDVCIGLRKTAGNAGHEITREKAFRENKQLGDERSALQPGPGANESSPRARREPRHR